MPQHDWVEIALDYRCNLRCLGCRACEDTGERLGSTDVLGVLREARARDIKQLWVGGGEPTLREDLGSVIATARKLGFTRVLVQTNGMRLAYPRFAEALVRAGVTDLSFNLKSVHPTVHDALSGYEGSHALLELGIKNARGTGATLVGDILLTRATLPDLAATVAHYAALGITRFTLWLLSISDCDDPAVAREVPGLDEVGSAIADAGTIAEQLGIELVSPHTPPCTLPTEHRKRYLPARSLRLVVVDPSGRSFPLEDSPFEGGVYPEPCTSCSVRQECGGARSDYLALHGPEAFAPLQPALRDPGTMP